MYLRMVNTGDEEQLVSMVKESYKRNCYIITELKDKKTNTTLTGGVIKTTSDYNEINSNKYTGYINWQIESDDYPNFYSTSSESFYLTSLCTDAKEIEEKGILVKELDNGEKIIKYGTCYEDLTNTNEIQGFLYNSSLEKKGKIPFAINRDGTVFYADIAHDPDTNENYIILEGFFDNNGIPVLKNVPISEVNIDAIKNNKMAILKEKPIEWHIKNNTAISFDTILLVGEAPEREFSTTKAVIKSDEFQIAHGFTPTIEKKKKNPFRAQEMKLDDKIKKCFRIGAIPFLVGEPGIGKTEIIESQSKHVLKYNMATWKPDSFTGKSHVVNGDVEKYIDADGKEITHIKKTRTENSEPTWLTEVKEALEEAKIDGEDVILFLDEFDKLKPAMQTFVNGIIDNEPTLGDWKIPKGVKIALAGNTTVDSLASNKISSEVASRLIKIDVKPNVEEWLKWAASHDVDPIVIAYIKTYPSDILTTEYGEDNRKDPSLSLNPRKWEKMISKELIESRKDGSDLMFNEYLTDNQVKKIMDFIDKYYENEIDNILEGNASPFVTEELDKNSFTVPILTVITKKEQLRNVLNYIKNNEFRNTFINLWIKYHPGDDNKMAVYEITQELKAEEEEFKNGFKK